MSDFKEIISKFDSYSADDPQIAFNYLSPDSGNWAGPHRSWIFRGQRDSSWGLLPSVFREENIKKWSEFGGRKRFSHSQFCECEDKLIKRFVKLSDSVGLKIPTDSFIFRVDSIINPELFPPPRNMEVWAIAQHHGIPTRLLDFTHNSFYAAYFSAYSCIKEKDSEGKLSIWAINMKSYYDQMKGKAGRVQLASVPTFDNNYLYSQKAVFLYEKIIHGKWENEIPIGEIDFTLKKAIWEDCQQYSLEIRSIIKKFDYPKHKSKELIHRLHQNDIHLASLRPNYDSIKESMEMEDYLKFQRM